MSKFYQCTTKCSFSKIFVVHKKNEKVQFAVKKSTILQNQRNQQKNGKNKFFLCIGAVFYCFIDIGMFGMIILSFISVSFVMQKSLFWHSFLP